MLRRFLSEISGDGKIFLAPKWYKKIEGLVRVPFFDPDDVRHGYVVYYSEVKRQYGLIKYELESGETVWESAVGNGGYGTPAVYGDLIVVLKDFRGVAAFDKFRGELLWELDTEARVRGSVNILDDLICFTSGGEVYFVDTSGRIVTKLSFPGMFLYGTVSKRNEHYIAIGTRFDEKANDSCLYVIAFDSGGRLLYEENLGPTPVISSDTSGGWIDVNGDFYIGRGREIIKLSLDDGRIVWRREVGGVSSRHLPVADDQHVYYTTLNGEVGCLSAESGEKVWSVSTQEGAIVAPPSIYDGTLLVLADSSLYLVDKATGSFYSRKVVGHCPYSAASIFNDSVFVGGGEPPMNGALFAYAVDRKHQNTELLQDHFEVGNYVESERMQIVVRFVDSPVNLSLDSSVISPESAVKPRMISKGLFIFDFRLKPNLLKGYYALPITYSLGDQTKTEMVRVYLFQKKALPQRYRINRFYKHINQTERFNSGAALTEAVLREYGKSISQAEFRKIIDHIKAKSNWKDADFQTWRLVLKRALSSPAQSLEEFVELERQDRADE